MQQVEIIALQRDAKPIIEFLQRSGVVEINRKSDDEPVLDAEGEPLIKLQTHTNIAQFEKTLQLVNTALTLLDTYAPIKKSMLSGLRGRQELSIADFKEHASRIDSSLRTAREINALSQKIEAADVAISHTRTQLESVLPWEGLSIPMQFAGTRFTAAIIGSLPAEYTEETLLAALGEAYHADNEILEFPPVSISIASSTRELSCIVVLCHRKDEETVRTTLRKIGLSIPSDPTTHPPEFRIGRFRKRIEAALQEKEEAIKQLNTYSGERDNLAFLSDYYLMRKDKYEAIGKLLFSAKTFILEGYVPLRDAKTLEEKLISKFDVSVAILDTDENDEDVPVLLKNNPLVTPVEDIVRSYSLPSKNDVDPNAAMAVFYYLFFGLMLSDAGYGVLMVILTLLVLRFLKPEGAMKANMQKFCLCGLSTVFWGALFGSWFGNIVYAVSTTFFGKTITLAPLWFDPVTDPLKLLILSLILGFAHIMVGLALRFYNMWRHGERIDALLDIGLWWVVFAAIGMMIGDMVLTVSFPLQKIGLYVLAAAGVGLVLTQGRSSKSIPGKIMGGIASLYNITAYFSDVLSYSRLMALSLVTGIIGTVVNTIGSIGGGGIGGAIIFIAVFIFGHTINIGINILGAYVHVNRLQYVEFFSKFYEGGGKPFMPFGVNTKRFKFKEEK
jgi:V/A-type H+-transporting ATPase subunit I